MTEFLHTADLAACGYNFRPLVHYCLYFLLPSLQSALHRFRPIPLFLNMPRSKRSKVTTLAKTPIRTTKASKAALVTQIRDAIDQYEHVWVFSVGDMRNEGLKQVRAQWRGSGRFYFGKGKVMAKALGETPETEHQEGLHQLASVSHLTSVESFRQFIELNFSVCEAQSASFSPLTLSTRLKNGSRPMSSPNMRAWARSPREILSCQKVSFTSQLATALTKLTDRPDLNPLHGACVWRSFPPFHGAAIASAWFGHNPGQGCSILEQRSRRLCFRRKVEQREVSDLEIAGSTDGGEQTLTFDRLTAS